MENSLIEIRSKSTLSKAIGTWVIRVTKEGVECFAEGIVTALGNKIHLFHGKIFQVLK